MAKATFFSSTSATSRFPGAMAGLWSSTSGRWWNVSSAAFSVQVVMLYLVVSPTVAITNNRSITTNVLVADGETLVLGGIYQESRRSGATKVPVLGDLPGLGVLFRSKTRSNTKQELLVFVTPRILREGLTLK